MVFVVTTAPTQEKQRSLWQLVRAQLPIHSQGQYCARNGTAERVKDVVSKGPSTKPTIYMYAIVCVSPANWEGINEINFIWLGSIVPSRSPSVPFNQLPAPGQDFVPLIGLLPAK